MKKRYWKLLSKPVSMRKLLKINKAIDDDPKMKEIRERLNEKEKR